MGLSLEALLPESFVALWILWQASPLVEARKSERAVGVKDQRRYWDERR